MKDYKEKICNTKIIISNSRLEVYRYNNYSFKIGKKRNYNNGRRGNSELSKEEKEINTIRRRKTTLIDARNKIIRLIKCNEDLRTFITLTYASNVDFETSKEHLKKFFRKLKNDYADLKYLWVLELTKVGRVHYHILTNIDFGIPYKDKKQKKTEEHKRIERDIAEKYWAHGFIDIRNLGAEVDNVALYVSCYLVKDLLDKKELRGQRVFGYSYRTMKTPTIYKYWSDENIEDFLKNILEDYELKFTNNYDISTEGTVNYFDLEERKNGNINNDW